MEPQLPVELAAALLAGVGPLPETSVVSSPVSRRDLLTAQLDRPTTVATVEVKEVVLGPHVHAPLHLHPCPVVGVVREGVIAYQREGEAERLLRPGDAFYEPAQARVARFDNAGEAVAKFTAFYLLGPGQTELLRILPE